MRIVLILLNLLQRYVAWTSLSYVHRANTCYDLAGKYETAGDRDTEASIRARALSDKLSKLGG